MTDIPRIDKMWPWEMPDGHWIDGFGREVWIKNGDYHRENGPSIIWKDGATTWYQNGRLHRTDGPADQTLDGKPLWCLDAQHYSLDEWLEFNDEITDKQRFFLKLKYG